MSDVPRAVEQAEIEKRLPRAMEQGAIEKRQAAAVRPIDEDPLYIQLKERFERLLASADTFFLEELNKALVSSHMKWSDAIEDVKFLCEKWRKYTPDRINEDNRSEATANAELIKSNELLETVMKRAESDWAYLHTKIKGLQCLKDGTWPEAIDEIYKEIAWLQSENKRLSAVEVDRNDLLKRIDEIAKETGRLKSENEVLKASWEAPPPGVAVLPSLADYTELHNKLYKVQTQLDALGPLTRTAQQFVTNYDDSHYGSQSGLKAITLGLLVKRFEELGWVQPQQARLQALKTKQRTAEPEPPVPCRGVDEPEDSSIEEPIKEKEPAQARRAAQGESDPFEQRVAKAVLVALPVMRELRSIFRGKRD